MATATTQATSLSLRAFSSSFNPKPYQFLSIRISSTPFASSTGLPCRRIVLARNPIQRNCRSGRSLWRLHATSEETLALEATTLVEKSREIASTSDDGASTVISVLLLVAFVGLSVLTIGVIYIAVTDFLQKREKEKFEKEEAADKKSGKKKKKVRTKAGPRGFGQKIEVEEEEEED